MSYTFGNSCKSCKLLFDGGAKMNGFTGPDDIRRFIQWS